MSNPRAGAVSIGSSAAAASLAGPVLLTVSDVASQLRLKPAAIRALARRGEIGFYRVGRAIRFQPGDVEAYLERQRRPARGERAMRGVGPIS